MTAEKIAITLPPEQVAAAKEAVAAGRAGSVSAYISAAVAKYSRTEGLSDLVATMRAEDGVPSEEDYAWAAEVLGLDR
jgi:Arc/MetJ-type ribon-helix-helix transcriptional regulator